MEVHGRVTLNSKLSDEIPSVFISQVSCVKPGQITSSILEICRRPNSEIQRQLNPVSTVYGFTN